MPIFMGHFGIELPGFIRLAKVALDELLGVLYGVAGGACLGCVGGIQRIILEASLSRQKGQKN